LKKQNDLEKAKKRKSANWLIDAVEEEKRREMKSGTGSRDELRSDREAEMLATPNGPNAATSQEPTPATAAKAGDRPQERRSNTPASNPLTSFMSDWMTPQDLALLQANGVSGAAPGAVTPMANTADPAASIPTATAQATGSSLESALGALGVGANKNSAPAASVTHENPFLQNLTGADSLSAAFSAPVFTPPPPPPSPAPTVFTAPPAEPAPTRSAIPDFLRPSEDAQAFKPMKRF
jgi:hypothetical protein